ncbi:hypothetical protein OROHE_005512 [Orobanche hederae]
MMGRDTNQELWRSSVSSCHCIIFSLSLSGINCISDPCALVDPRVWGPRCVIFPILFWGCYSTKLTGHDKNLDDLSLSLQTLADKFNKIKGKQDNIMDLVHNINSHVSEINARKGEEESREVARCWRLQKEAELNAVFDDSIAAAINRLAVPRQGYRVSGHRPEHHDSSIPWKQLVQAPPKIRLPTDRQPSPEDIKQWKNNKLMRLAMLSKHKKGDRITHPEDWILSYDKLYEGMDIYLNRGQDALMNWWKDTEFDPRKQRPWRHEHQFRK